METHCYGVRREQLGSVERESSWDHDNYVAKLGLEFGAYADDARRIAGDRIDRCKTLSDYLQVHRVVALQLRSDMLAGRNVLEIPAPLIGLYEQVRTALNVNANAKPEVIGSSSKIWALQHHLTCIGISTDSTPVVPGSRSDTYRMTAWKTDDLALPMARAV
jgi:hypothetical protein